MIFPKEPMTPDQAIVYAAGQLEEKVEQLETALADASAVNQRIAEVLLALKPRLEGSTSLHVSFDTIWSDSPKFKLVVDYFNLRKEEE